MLQQAGSEDEDVAVLVVSPWWPGYASTCSHGKEKIKDSSLFDVRGRRNEKLVPTSSYVRGTYIPVVMEVSVAHHIFGILFAAERGV